MAFQGTSEREREPCEWPGASFYGLGLAQDLSNLDFSQFEPARFEFEKKDEQINMRVPKPLLAAVKARAKARGIPLYASHSRNSRTGNGCTKVTIYSIPNSLFGAQRFPHELVGRPWADARE